MTDLARPIPTASGSVPVEYSMFYAFCEEDGGPSSDDVPTGDQIILALESGVSITSAATDHEARVGLELW